MRVGQSELDECKRLEERQAKEWYDKEWTGFQFPDGWKGKMNMLLEQQSRKTTEELRMNPRGLMMNSTVMMTKMTRTRTQSLVVVTQIRTSPEQPLVRMRGKSTMHCQRAVWWWKVIYPILIYYRTYQAEPMLFIAWNLLYAATDTACCAARVKLHLRVT